MTFGGARLPRHSMEEPVTYEAGSSFRPAFFFLRPAQRRALSAYYGFARAVDDIVDEPGVPASDKEAGLALWRAAVERIFSGRPSLSPLESALAGAAKEFPLKPEHFTLVIDGVAMDLSKSSYATYAELERYMYGVASAVGLACLAIFGYDDENAPLLARRMGYAVQLTNIIRDVSEDLAAGRVYIPQEDLARFRCRPSDLAAGSQYTPDFIELMEFEAARARELYAGALALAARGQKRRLAPALVMSAVYRELLFKMERNGFRVKDGKVKLGAGGKVKAIFKAWRDYAEI